MPCEKLKKLLDAEKVEYLCIPHSPTFTAQTTAEATHVSGRILAKTLIVDLDGEMAMAVIPANQKLFLGELRDLTDCERVKLVSEQAFKKRFPDCETGAMPPFGNLYGMDVYVDASLCHNHDIAFNAGSHAEVVVMSFADYERIAEPKILELTA